MSKIIVNKSTGKVVCELNDTLADHINTEKYKAVDVKEYLQNLNLELNNGMTYKDKVEAGLL